MLKIPYTKHEKGMGNLASESSPKRKRPGANSWVNNKLRSNFMGFLWCWGWERGKGRKVFNSYKPRKVESDFAFAFGLGVIKGENKTPLYFSSPLLSVKILPRRKVVLVIWKRETMC